MNTKGPYVLWGLSVTSLASWEELGFCPFHCCYRGPGPEVGIQLSTLAQLGGGVSALLLLHGSPPRGCPDHSVNMKHL